MPPEKADQQLADIVICTPTAAEWQQMNRHINDVVLLDYELPTIHGRIGPYSCICCASGKGQEETAAIVALLVARCKAKWFFIVGIAGGFPALKVQRGDLVVARTIFSFDYGKLTNGVFVRRNRQAVIRIVLQEFPTPSPLTPWQQILGFRKDPRAMAQFMALKGWINHMGTRGLKQYEVIDVLRDMLAEYAAAMAHYDLKPECGALEVLITPSAEVAQEITHWEKSQSKGPVMVASERLTLLPEERDRKGREIMYIINARKRFQN